MNNLKVLTTAVALLFVTPVLAQEMGGATGPGSASGLEPTYNNGYYNGYGQGEHLRAGGGALDGNNSYAMTPALERTTDLSQTSRHVRKVPIGDISALQTAARWTRLLCVATELVHHCDP
jgi:hypothetical protein